MTNCKFCNTPSDSKYCPSCGHPMKVKRIDRHFITHELIHSIFHVDGGIFYTIKELAIRPGPSIRRYVDGEAERFRHFKPFGFLIITSLIYGFVSHYIGYREPETEADYGTFLIKWLESNDKYAALLSVVFIAPVLRFIFYRKQSFNIFEYIILLSFITGQVMLAGVLAEALTGILHSEIPGDVYMVLLFLFYGWAIGGFFGVKGIGGYLKAFLAYFVSIILFMIFVIIADGIAGLFL